LYCDRRVFGVERWYLQKPAGADLRLPDDIKTSVCFLFVKKGNAQLYGGTAFFVVHEETPIIYTGFMVTARHCVESAYQDYGNLYARINVKSGLPRVVELPLKDWKRSDRADVALLPFVPDPDDAISFLPTQSFMIGGQIVKENIGIGDEVFLTGLFTKRYGTQKNIPIVRSGIISAMPEEPIQDSPNSVPYNAYLIEVRSIGGLSGNF
jgi:hypothetical protein